LDELTSVQISEWEAYDRIDPVGTWREDFRMAFLSSLITNLTISVHGKKGAKQTTLMDFMPKWEQTGEVGEVKKQSVEDMKKALLEIAGAQNKKEARKKNEKRPPSQLNTKK
jgi:hypothetical protein